MNWQVFYLYILILPPSNLSLQRWFHDGTVKCFSGGHIGLTLLALIVILYLLITIPSFFIMSFDKSDRVRETCFTLNVCIFIVSFSLSHQIHRCFHFAAQSVNAQFKEKYFYWGTIILLKKMIIVVLLVAIPSKLVRDCQQLLVFCFVFCFVFVLCFANKNRINSKICVIRN